MPEFPCPECSAVKNFHRRGCSLKQKGEFIQGLKCPACGVKPTLSGIYYHEEGCEFFAEGIKPAENKELIRSTPELPKVGDWYVLRFFVPMGFDIEQNRKTYSIQITMAQVQEIRQHGRDFKVMFDMETNYKEFTVQFDGDLFTKADKMAKALR